MPQDQASEEGRIDAVFVHRFVLRREDGSRVLADLGPEGARTFALAEGMEVAVQGQRKPSEIKVIRITKKDGTTIEISHGKPGMGKRSVRQSNRPPSSRSSSKEDLAPLAEPRRKPKHFEVLARRGAALVEVHVGLDGTLRKEQPADRGKWASALAVG